MKFMHLTFSLAALVGVVAMVFVAPAHAASLI